MDEERKIKPLIPICAVLIVTTVILAVLCVILWRQKADSAREYENACEKLEIEYEKVNEKLAETEKLAKEYKESYEKLVEENEAAKIDSEKYEKDLNAVIDLMLDGAITTENCANLMQSVWHNSIFRIQDSKTDKYTLTSNGSFHDDFNTALGNLFRDNDFVKDTTSIRENQNEVIKRIRDLKNPPDEWKDAYADLLLYYDAYYDFTELVLGRECSLNEFKDLFKQFDGEAAKRYDKMKLHLE